VAGVMKVFVCVAIAVVRLIVKQNAHDQVWKRRE
jgi:hypothetical protein